MTRRTVPPPPRWRKSSFAQPISKTTRAAAAARLSELRLKARDVYDEIDAIQNYLGGNPGSRASAAVRGEKKKRRNEAIREAAEQVSNSSAGRRLLAGQFGVDERTIRRALGADK